MNSGASLCVNDRRIAHDTIDGEVIIVNFENGKYFSLQTTAATIWKWLAEGHPVSNIISYIEANFGGTNATRVDSFIGQLIAECLLESGNGVPGELGELHGMETDEPFSAPQLSQYEDMQELILLDPIHEVDATGWPNRAA